MVVRAVVVSGGGCGNGGGDGGVGGTGGWLARQHRTDRPVAWASEYVQGVACSNGVVEGESDP